jgi:hypothetical protein
VPSAGFQRDFISDHQEALAHDAWFQAEIDAGLRELEDPNVELIDNEVVEAEWEHERAALIKQIEETQEKASRPQR